jgi:hypothetical protein
MAIIIAYEHVFNGSYSPHLFIGFYMHEILKRVNITFRYDVYNKGFSSIKHLDTIFFTEVLYRLTNNIEIGFSYREGLTIEGSANNSVSNLYSLTIHTKVIF